MHPSETLFGLLSRPWMREHGDASPSVSSTCSSLSEPSGPRVVGFNCSAAALSSWQADSPAERCSSLHPSPLSQQLRAAVPELTIKTRTSRRKNRRRGGRGRRAEEASELSARAASPRLPACDAALSGEPDR